MENKGICYRLISKVIRSLVDIISDETYLKWLFRISVGYKPNFKTPRSYNEKLQWLKLHDIHPEYTELVDKVAVKAHVSKLIGSEHIIQTLGVWDTVEEINWDSLPARFVIKCTGDSGGVVVCKDKSTLDIEAAQAKLLNGWGQNYYKYNKEYPYRNIKPRIIAEVYMEDESGYELKDYKIFCSYGQPKFLFVATGRQCGDVRFDFYDTEFNHLSVTNDHPNADVWPTRPKNFDEMLRIASRLSEGIPQVRVDLYNCNGRIYFGELTFFHFSGLHPFVPQEWDFRFGQMIQLPHER